MSKTLFLYASNSSYEEPSSYTSSTSSKRRSNLVDSQGAYNLTIEPTISLSESTELSASTQLQTEKTPRRDVQSWNAESVSSWLRKINLGELESLFLERDVKGTDLLDLNEHDMRNDLKLVFGQRKQLLKSLQEFS